MENIEIISDLTRVYLKELKSISDVNKAESLRKFNNFTIFELNKFAKMLWDLSIGVSDFNKEVDITSEELNIIRAYYKLIEIDWNNTYYAFTDRVRKIRNKIITKAMCNAQLEYCDANKPIDLKTPISNMYLTSSTYNFIKNNIVVENGETITLRHLIVAFKSTLAKKLNLDSPKKEEIAKLIEACGYNENYIASDTTLEDRYEFLKKLKKQIEKEQDELNKRHTQVLLELDEIKKQKSLNI